MSLIYKASFATAKVVYLYRYFYFYV